MPVSADSSMILSSSRQRSLLHWLSRTIRRLLVMTAIHVEISANMLHVLFQGLVVPDIFLEFTRVFGLEIVIWLCHDLSLMRVRRRGPVARAPLGLTTQRQW